MFISRRHKRARILNPWTQFLVSLVQMLLMCVGIYFLTELLRIVGINLSIQEGPCQISPAQVTMATTNKAYGIFLAIVERKIFESHPQGRLGLELGQ